MHTHTHTHTTQETHTYTTVPVYPAWQSSMVRKWPCHQTRRQQTLAAPHCRLHTHISGGWWNLVADLCNKTTLSHLHNITSHHPSSPHTTHYHLTPPHYHLTPPHHITTSLCITSQHHITTPHHHITLITSQHHITTSQHHITTPHHNTTSPHHNTTSHHIITTPHHTTSSQHPHHTTSSQHHTTTSQHHNSEHNNVCTMEYISVHSCTCTPHHACMIDLRKQQSLHAQCRRSVSVKARFSVTRVRVYMYACVILRLRMQI